MKSMLEIGRFKKKKFTDEDNPTKGTMDAQGETTLKRRRLYVTIECPSMPASDIFEPTLNWGDLLADPIGCVNRGIANETEIESKLINTLAPCIRIQELDPLGVLPGFLMGCPHDLGAARVRIVQQMFKMDFAMVRKVIEMMIGRLVLHDRSGGDGVMVVDVFELEREKSACEVLSAISKNAQTPIRLPGALSNETRALMIDVLHETYASTLADAFMIALVSQFSIRIDDDVRSTLLYSMKMVPEDVFTVSMALTIKIATLHFVYSFLVLNVGRSWPDRVQHRFVTNDQILPFSGTCDLCIVSKLHTSLCNLACDYDNVMDITAHLDHFVQYVQLVHDIEDDLSSARYPANAWGARSHAVIRACTLLSVAARMCTLPHVNRPSLQIRILRIVFEKILLSHLHMMDKWLMTVLVRKWDLRRTVAVDMLQKLLGHLESQTTFEDDRLVRYIDSAKAILNEMAN